jgi:glycosyltransferase involved in cell wall biosynthesis
MRYAGITNNRIKIISDYPFNYHGQQTLRVPASLDNVPNDELLLYYKVKDGKFSSSSLRKPASKLKVAIITNYRRQCGISTYAENLFPAMAPLLGDYRLFIETNTAPTGEISPDKMITCWTRGQPLTGLVKAIKDYDPDIVLINHEYGLFPDARHWLSLISQLSEYRVITILHSVFPHHLDKLICEAALPEIVVHQEAAKLSLLNDKQVHGKIHVIPHGCYPITQTDKLWNLYHSSHTFIQFGFGFHYKNFQLSLQAVSLLKNKYPDVFFTALFSESPHNKVGHQMYFNELMDLSKTLDIQDHVAIIRGFQSETTMDSYLRTNSVAVFPYGSDPGHQVFGSSGAARMAMSKGIPVITSTIPHFTDLPTIKADTPQQIADALDRLFSDAKLQKERIDKQLSFIKANSWDNTAIRFVELMTGDT